MNSSEWLYSDHYHPLAVAMIFGVAGFFLGNLENDSNLFERARPLAYEAMVAALVPNCLELSINDKDRDAKLLTISGTEKYLQREAIKQSGWATVPGSESASHDLAAACLDLLDFAPSRDLTKNSFDAD